MIILQAPHELIQTTTLLPNPILGDEESPALDMALRRAMDGTVYTKIKTNSRSQLTYNFELTYLKALELEAFITAYYVENIRLTNYKDEVWVMKISTDPFDKTVAKRGEITTVSLRFEGVKIDG